jgi:hypothetical protein
MSPEGRREVIIKAAIALTREAGCIDSWSRQDVANKCVPPTSPETVKHYYLMPDLRGAVRALLDK